MPGKLRLCAVLEPSVLPLLSVRSNPAAFSPATAKTNVEATMTHVGITMTAALPTGAPVQCLVCLVRTLAIGSVAPLHRAPWVIWPLPALGKVLSGKLTSTPALIMTNNSP